MRQDGAKMRKMEDVSSVLGPLGGHEGRGVANNGPKMATGGPQAAPRWPQDGPKRSQGEANMDQDSSR